MTTRARAAIALLALACPLIASAATESAQEWLLRMHKALATRSYAGTVVYLGSQEPVTYNILVCGDGIAKLTAMSGPAREIIRDSDLAVRRRADGATMVVDGIAGAGSPLPFPPASQIDLSELDYYQPSFAGWDRVAGVRTRVLALVPRDRWRYGYRLWIGEDSGLPLRSELVNDNGRVLAQAFFTRLEMLTAAAAREKIGAKSISLLEQAERSESKDTRGACSGEGIGHIELNDLPPGFHLLSTVCERAPGAATPVTHLLIGDGLATVSIFLAPHRPRSATLIGGTALGSVHAVGRLAQGFSVTAMGDAPFPTVSRIAGGVVVSSQ